MNCDYDVLDRIVQIKYNGNIRYKYYYNGNGDLYEIEDRATRTRYRYEYDSLGRPCASYTIIDDTIRIVSDYTYDGKSRVTEYTCGMAMPGTDFANLGHTYGYVYNDANGTMSSMTVTANGTVDTMTYAYDALQRLTSQTIQRSTGLTLAKEYSFKNLSGNQTTQQISSYTAKVNGTAVDSYSYTYDSLGNITVINRSGNLPVYYTYDAQNQLVSVLEGDFRYDFTYDTYGNILSVACVEDYSDEVVSENEYEYADSGWIDRLTAFNGHAITYDEIGNPLTYYNGSDYAFTWDGRELAAATKNKDENNSTAVSYKYGADGLRTQKTVGSTVYNYYYADGLLVRQTWGTNYMDFLYDETNSAYSFIYNGAQYYYVKNLQGDIVKIVNTSGNVVASYSYDAWGKVTNSGNIVGLYNPIRYRGYYYDTDTGFYYLQSRYYDPTIKRFINADDASLLGANGDFISFNLYAYCLNNPTMYSDESGYAPKWLKTVLDVGIYAVSAAAAVVAGLAVSLVASPVVGVATGVATFGIVNNLTNTVYYNYISDGKSDLTSSSYNDGYINRWDRLDYTKSQDEMPNAYDSTARRYFSEYNLHMYGWYLTEWSYKKGIPLISNLADSAKDAEVKINTWDKRWYINVGTVILGWLGL